MTRPRHELPDEFLEVADRFVSLANEPGENVKEIEPAHRAAQREKPQ
jgi:hypothetical protein